jgi:hypothetical protein
MTAKPVVTSENFITFTRPEEMVSTRARIVVAKNRTRLIRSGRAKKKFFHSQQIVRSFLSWRAGAAASYVCPSRGSNFMSSSMILVANGLNAEGLSDSKLHEITPGSGIESGSSSDQVKAGKIASPICCNGYDDELTRNWGHLSWYVKLPRPPSSRMFDPLNSIPTCQSADVATAMDHCKYG